MSTSGEVNVLLFVGIVVAFWFLSNPNRPRPSALQQESARPPFSSDWRQFSYDHNSAPFGPGNDSDFRPKLSMSPPSIHGSFNSWHGHVPLDGPAPKSPMSRSSSTRFLSSSRSSSVPKGITSKLLTKARTRTKSKRPVNNYPSLMGTAGAHLRDTDWDGDSLFASLSDQINGDWGKNHMAIRQAIISEIRRDPAHYKTLYDGKYNEPFELYLRRMAQKGEYGSDLEIAAFARHFKTRVKIHTNYETGDGSAYLVSGGKGLVSVAKTSRDQYGNVHYMSVGGLKKK